MLFRIYLRKRHSNGKETNNFTRGSSIQRNFSQAERFDSSSFFKESLFFYDSCKEFHFFNKILRFEYYNEREKNYSNVTNKPFLQPLKLIIEKIKLRIERVTM